MKSEESACCDMDENATRSVGFDERVGVMPSNIAIKILQTPVGKRFQSEVTDFDQWRGRFKDSQKRSGGEGLQSPIPK